MMISLEGILTYLARSLTQIVIAILTVNNISAPFFFLSISEENVVSRYAPRLVFPIDKSWQSTSTKQSWSITNKT